MRLSRPVAAVLLVLCAVLVLVLALGQGGWTGDEPTSEQSGAAARPTSSEPTTPEPTSTTSEPTSDEPTSDQPTLDDETPAGAAAGEPVGTDTRDWDDVDACADGILPDELDPVVDDIEAGGPYDYGRDGVTFENREGYLPDESRGYYQEFTVETPGLDHRGAKRVVTGGGEIDPEVWYYTDDHYESFCEFAPAA
ncbi:putative ribonuclease [Serinicoccus hydrothermalis]|uniref:Putative ribonuclease n=1 Tax=Serinicoccus hydrothermalis TaxID=1758689 RepID=A0A1B1NC87_9MICO|nr:ribonuclease domain-containing protein [Serinicoccus hydrothermalis]ANS79047.1 putative ribonuclease [Serinicoccus hydrothermalis]